MWTATEDAFISSIAAAHVSFHLLTQVAESQAFWSPYFAETLPLSDLVLDFPSTLFASTCGLLVRSNHYHAGSNPGSIMSAHRSNFPLGVDGIGRLNSTYNSAESPD